MLLIRKSIYTLVILGLLPLLLVFYTSGSSFASGTHNSFYFQDTITPVRSGDSLRFPINDRRGDFVSGSSSKTNNQKDPSNIKDSVVYDAISRRYIVYEKIGNRFYRIPTIYSFDEYWQMRNRQAEVEYFKKRANTTSLLNRNRFSKPKLSLSEGLFNRLFGNGKIEISPQGNVDITAGYMGQ